MRRPVGRIVAFTEHTIDVRRGPLVFRTIRRNTKHAVAPHGRHPRLKLGRRSNDTRRVITPFPGINTIADYCGHGGLPVIRLLCGFAKHRSDNQVTVTRIDRRRSGLGRCNRVG